MIGAPPSGNNTNYIQLAPYVSIFVKQAYFKSQKINPGVKMWENVFL